MQLTSLSKPKWQPAHYRLLRSYLSKMKQHPNGDRGCIQIIKIIRNAFHESRDVDIERRKLREKEALQYLFYTNLSRFLDTVMGKMKPTERGAAATPDSEGKIPETKSDRLNTTLNEYKNKKIVLNQPK